MTAICKVDLVRGEFTLCVGNPYPAYLFRNLSGPVTVNDKRLFIPLSNSHPHLITVSSDPIDIADTVRAINAGLKEWQDEINAILASKERFHCVIGNKQYEFDLSAIEFGPWQVDHHHHATDATPPKSTLELKYRGEHIAIMGTRQEISGVYRAFYQAATDYRIAKNDLPEAVPNRTANKIELPSGAALSLEGLVMISSPCFNSGGISQVNEFWFSVGYTNNPNPVVFTYLSREDRDQDHAVLKAAFLNH